MADLEWTYQGAHFVCDEANQLKNLHKHRINMRTASTAFSTPALFPPMTKSTARPVKAGTV
jgi:hypothetical protein